MEDQQPIQVGQTWERIQGGRRVRIMAYTDFPSGRGGHVRHRPLGVKHSGSWCFGNVFRERYRLVEDDKP